MRLQVLGVSVGGTIIQNQLFKRLPREFLVQFAQVDGQAIDVVPQLRNLPQEELHSVRVAFADSLSLLWYIMAGISGLGLVACLWMKRYELHTRVDEDWGIKENDVEVNATNVGEKGTEAKEIGSVP